MLGASVLALAMVGASAHAAKNVANTSQKGSLLVFPKIDVSPGRTTIVRITNDFYRDVNVKCYWKNGTKYKRDLQFVVTKKQPFWIEARSGRGTVPVPAFPTSQGPFAPGDRYAGELKCWAVDYGGANQISWNHLQGAATVLDYRYQTAYEYSSWNFAARGGKKGRVHGAAGSLVLGGASGDYDACPQYLIGQFSPYQSRMDSIYFGETDLAVASCTQDLRQDMEMTYTTLKFSVWNEYEVKYTGAYHCMNSWHEMYLRDGQGGVQVGGNNFMYSHLQTPSARFKVAGVASNRCQQFTPRTQSVGLVGITAADIYFSGGRKAVAGTNLNGAGTKAGLILWDPAGDVPER